MQNENWRKWIPYALLVVSFLGFIDATSLTIDHYTEATLPCTFTHACQVVTTSEYSEIIGIPVSLLGSLYYLSIFLGTCLYFEVKSSKLLRILSLATITGFIASLWFVYLQLFVIKAICQYCMLSAASSSILFALGMLNLKFSGSTRHDA